jgi:hypothetical protein
MQLGPLPKQSEEAWRRQTDGGAGWAELALRQR